MSDEKGTVSSRRGEAPAAADGSLEARGITMRFAGLTALSEVDLEVKRGEVLGLIGPNGSGKTTLLNVISGVLDPTEGTVAMGGEELPLGSADRTARTGIRRTFQNIRLFQDMTVLETAEVPAAALGRTRERTTLALAALEQLGIAAHRDRIATELPYGLQRRLEMARAVVGDPAYLLLDEPAAGLNRAESDGLVKTILAIRDNMNCGVLLIDHDLPLITAACSRVVVLNEGKVIATGDPDSVRTDPAVVKAYLG